MTRFLLGLVLGVVVGGGGVLLWKRAPAETVAAAAAPPDAGVEKAKAGKKKGGGGGRRVADGDEPIPVLTPDDLRQRSAGDALTVRDRNMDLGSDAPEEHDLTQGEIDDAFRPAGEGIVACISDARGPAPVTGAISVGVVVGPDGKVVKSRVEAPAYLIEHGLYGCAKRKLAALRFPPPGRDTVITVPFNLE